MMTPIQKGNVGLGMAISYYTAKGYTVSLPLNDNQDYDLIADKEGVLNKVQVKTSSTKNQAGNIKVYLRTITSSTTGVKNIKKFQDCNVDLVFIGTGEGNMYEIPKAQITQNAELSLTEQYECYKVGSINLL